jgi:tRNA(Ile2) C34 agmatinyltransferase TiaS
MKELIRRILKETIKKNKVICDGCGWSWDLSDGGDDPYLCHKCGNDNTPKRVNKKRDE